jgi:hypothetical protein
LEAPFYKGSAMNDRKASKPYVAPALAVLGNVADVTLGCDKHLGSSDGFTFQGQAIVCSSA